MSDWGDGEYGRFAPSLIDACGHLLSLAAPRAGERAIDLGCGTGNATLPLLAAGAIVTAVDPSARLLAVTAEHAAAAGHHLQPVRAGAEALPLPDGDADLIVSNFGVIFCPEPEAAVREIVRVLAPGGRALFTAWLPEGPIGEIAKRLRAAGPGGEPARPQLAARPDPDAPATLLWHEPSTFAGLVPGGDTALSTHPGTAILRGDSPQAWFDQMAEHHPMWIAARRVIDPGPWASLREQGIGLLGQSVTSDGSVAIESPYVVVELRPQR